MEKTGFRLYLLFVLSYFLHLPARIPALGVIRSDFVLMAAILATIVVGAKDQAQEMNFQERSTRILWYLVLYILCTLPFVTWPGSVLHSGIPDFSKVVVFYFFTIYLVNTESKLKVFVAVVIGAQLFRVAEPLYLHLTQGYWGDFTTMEPGVYLTRLSGAPHDVVNPNGLAFVIVAIVPFLHYFLMRRTFFHRLVYLGLLSVLMYALLLTESRTGLVGLMIVLLMIISKSRYKALGILIVISALLIVPLSMSKLQRDRYLSTVDYHVPGGATSEGRISGLIRDFKVGLERPIIGHGMGTSEEANFNVAGVGQPSHDLFTEAFQELGFCGLFIVLLYIASVFRNLKAAGQIVGRSWIENNSGLARMTYALQAWASMYLVTSLATYGLSTYGWYLIGGLAVVVRRLVEEQGTTQTVSPEKEADESPFGAQPEVDFLEPGQGLEPWRHDS